MGMHNPSDNLKYVNFSESETDSIKSTSRNQKPLYDLPSLKKLRDRAAAIKTSKVLRLNPGNDASDATKVLIEMGIDVTGDETQKVIQDMTMKAKDKDNIHAWK